MPCILGAEFLQSPSRLTWSSLECYKLWLIKDGRWWLPIVCRHFVHNEEDAWRHFVYEGVALSYMGSEIYDHSNAVQRHINPTWFYINPEGLCWRFLRADSYATRTSVCGDTVIGNLTVVDNMGACLWTGKEHNIANMGHLLCDKQLRGMRRLFIWLKAEPNRGHQWSSSPTSFPKKKGRDICFHIKHLTDWKKRRIKKLSKQVMWRTSFITPGMLANLH